MKKTNVIFILADDMGYGDFGVFGDGSSRTPNLDRMVADGLCMTDYHTPAPVCAPARAGILTGRYPQRSGVICTFEASGHDRLALSETTLADVFRGAGYRTGLVGKWHLGAFDPRYHPCSRGFERFAGFRAGWSEYFDWTIERDGETLAADGRYLTDVFTDEAVAYIRENRDAPFFLHVAYNAPHFPFQAPEEYIRPFRETGRFGETLCTFYGMIACMDAGIGRILDAVRDCGLEEDTLIVFTSDNGPQLDGGVDRYNCELHGKKCTAYEGGIRLPAVVQWKGSLPAGGRSDDFMHGCDWFPTLLEACGIPLPQGLRLDGKSVLENLCGTPAPYGRQRFWQWNRYEPLLAYNGAVRDGRYKLVKPYREEIFQSSEEDSATDRWLKRPGNTLGELVPFGAHRSLPEPMPPELYDLEADPRETEDLAARMPGLRDRLLADYDAWFAEVERERGEIPL